MVVNCDIVIASEKASFAFPEPNVGVVAAQGAIPRMVRIAGHQVRHTYPSSLLEVVSASYSEPIPESSRNAIDWSENYA